MSEEPKIKHQKCKICDHVFICDYCNGDIGCWCWEAELRETEVNATCYKWEWNGIDEK